MQHLTRWRTVTAAAATAALAAGALGIAGAVDNDDRPAAIELTADTDTTDLQITDLSAESQASAADVTATQTAESRVSAADDTMASVDATADSGLSLESRDEEVRTDRSAQQTATVERTGSPDSPSSAPSLPSPPSSPSVDSPDEPVSTQRVAPDSPVSQDSPISQDSPDSPSSMDSVSSVSS